MTPSPSKSERRIVSYGRRRGRKLHGVRERLLEELLPRLQLGLEEARAWRDRPAWLEIGFGGGEHLAARAAAHADVTFIGCEPYVDGVASLLKMIEAAALGNVRIFPGDARDMLEALPEAAIARAFILFPDPWPKARHHKRRLIQPEFLAMLHRVMEPGAELLLASDHDDYVAWMLEAVLASPYFTWEAREQHDWLTPPEGWVRTKYQEKAEREGRGTAYLRLTRVGK